MSPDGSIPNTCSVWRRKGLTRPLEKMLSLFARRVKGHYNVTPALCLFSGSPHGSVSNCGRGVETLLSCSRGSQLLNSWVENKMTAGHAVCIIALVLIAPVWLLLPLLFQLFSSLDVSIHQFVFFWSFFLFLPCCSMRSSFWPLVSLSQQGGVCLFAFHLSFITPPVRLLKCVKLRHRNTQWSADLLLNDYPIHVLILRQYWEPCPCREHLQ